MFGSATSTSAAAPWSNHHRLHSRRLLLVSKPPNSPSSSPYNQPQPPITTVTTTITQQNPAEVITTPPPSNGFDANVVMVLSVLLCALICSLGLNSIIRCALRCSSFTAPDPNNSQNTQNNNNNNAGCSRLANTGIKKKALKSFTTVNYSADLNLPALDNTCAICLYEFVLGDRVRLLPKCNHGFHIRCIDQWLNSHSSCPTCRNCLIETCQKIAGCNQQASSSQPSLQPLPPLPPHGLVQETVISSIAPLERETTLRPPYDLVHDTVININSLQSETPIQPQLPPHGLAHEAAAATHMVPLERDDPTTIDSIRVTHL